LKTKGPPTSDLPLFRIAVGVQRALGGRLQKILVVRDFSVMASSEESPEQITVEGIEVDLPAATAIPLGFIASELIINAAKYGRGRIATGLGPVPK
jgi:two-component sensor histidine kinase